jgi:hypothetical protein
MALGKEDERIFSISPKRRQHILDGDLTGGGHGPGRRIPGKSEFPSTMSDDEIIAGIEAIANDRANYPGGVIPTAGGRAKINGKIGGLQTSVIVDLRTQEIVTAWPEGVPRNP